MMMTEIYRLERRAYKNMASDNDLHSATSVNHNRHYFQQIAWNLNQLPALYILMQAAAILNTCCMARKVSAEQ
jgi:hypothetical protein